MVLSEFGGIRAFHDGMAVSDYVNMIPLEASCIDRLGEKILIDVSSDQKVIQTFVDSKRNVYIATNKGVSAYTYNPVRDRWQRIQLTSSWNPSGYFEYIENSNVNHVSFCESTTKPSQVFMCDGRYVYYWNTEQLVSDGAKTAIANEFPGSDYVHRVEAFTANLMPLGDFTNIGDQFNSYPVTTGTETGYRYGWWPTLYDGTWVPKTTYYTGDLWVVSSITWYENRLVCVDKHNNMIRLSAIRPDRWIVPTFVELRQKYMPFQIWELLEPNQPQDRTYNFVPHAYQSTASSASLEDAVAFGGQLYFLNDTTIEVWTNTYNEDAPIQQNAVSTISFGGRSPCIVADMMYIIAKDAYHNDFIAVIGQNGQLKRISNDEVERRLAGRASIIRPLSVRDNSFVVVYNSDSYGDVDLRQGLSVTREGKWWTYDNRYLKSHKFGAWSIVTFGGRQFDVGNHGELVEQDPTSRLHADGTSTILRYMRGAFTQLPTRAIVRSVEVVCDTGVAFDNSRGKMYLRLSFDRGLSFGKYLYRTMGQPGDNDRQIIWRNCGSGNSFLVEFGTSDNVRFQLYQIGFELQ